MSRTYRRTRKGRKVTWLPNISDSDVFGGGRWGYWHEPDPDKLAFIQKHPHRIADVDDYFDTSNCCGCSWCLHEKKHRVLREIADAEIKAAYEGRESAFETLKPKKTKKYRKPFEVWKRTVYRENLREARNYWLKGWYRIGRYKKREDAEYVMEREKRIWKAFEKEDYWYQFEIREVK